MVTKPIAQLFRRSVTNNVGVVLLSPCFSSKTNVWYTERYRRYGRDDEKYDRKCKGLVSRLGLIVHTRSSRLISTCRLVCLWRIIVATFNNSCQKSKSRRRQKCYSLRVHLERLKLMSHCGDSDEWTVFRVRRSNVFERVRKGSGKAERGTYRFSSANTPNLGLDRGLVYEKSSSNYGSGLNFSITKQKRPRWGQESGRAFSSRLSREPWWFSIRSWLLLLSTRCVRCWCWS